LEQNGLDARKIASEYRLAKWAQRIQKRQESGQSIKEFCASEGISKNTYFYWLRKLRQSALEEYDVKEAELKTELVPIGWTKLKALETSRKQTEITIEAGGYRVLATADTDAELLAKILRMLKTL
jgi:putative transposase